MLPEALDLPQALQSLTNELSEIIGDRTSALELTASLENLNGFPNALTARLSQTRLAATKEKVNAAIATIPKSAVPVHLNSMHLAADSD